MEVNGANLAALRTSYNTIFNSHFEAVESTHKRISMTVPSTTASNNYKWLKKLKGMRKWVGPRVIDSLASAGYVLENEPFENTVAVDRYDIEDDQYGTYNPAIGDLGQTVAEHPDELCWGVLKKGFEELCFDGQPFIDTDHPALDANGKEISVSNYTAGAEPAWFLMDTTRAIKPIIYQERQKARFVAKDSPTDDHVFNNNEFLYGVDYRAAAGYGLWQLIHGATVSLNEDNYAAVRQAMMELKADHGRPLNIRPRLLVVPPALEKAALKLVQAENNANGETNVYRNSVEVHVEPMLAA
ncbi:MAG: Mu-like prophage major head subunit gpT family protein [Magnetovibrionaceae bacterium]